MRYEQLRAEYDAAFDRLRAEMSRQTTEPTTRDRVNQALAAYRERRNQLAEYLASSRAEPRDRRETAVLAYRLWEQAGRPIGNPDEHWLRAEQMLADKQ